MKFSIKANNAITNETITLVDETGKMCGKIRTIEAQQIAKEKGLDLVLVGNPCTESPVCKFVQLDKLKYQLSKKDKASRKWSTKLKEIRITKGIGKNDLDRKLADALDFLDKKYKIKILCINKKRSSALASDQDLNREILDKLKDHAILDSAPKTTGKVTIICFSPK